MDASLYFELIIAFSSISHEELQPSNELVHSKEKAATWTIKEMTQTG